MARRVECEAEPPTERRTPAESAAYAFAWFPMEDGGRVLARPEFAAPLADPSLWDRSPGRGGNGRGMVRAARIPAPSGAGAPPIRIVIRPYWHGGTLRLFTRDLFLSADRGMREVEFASWLQDLGIPSVEVLGLRVRRARLGLWRLAIATREVSGGTDLLTFARTGLVHGEPVPRKAVAAAAAHLLRRLHEEGVHHRDLHLGNLLVTGGRSPRSVVIDLDKCDVERRLPEDARRAMLARLYRSLRKCEVACGRAHFGRTGLARFLAIYSGERWRDDWRAVARRFRRGYPVHRLVWWVGSVLRALVPPRFAPMGPGRRPAAGREEAPWLGRPFPGSARSLPSAPSRSPRI